MTIAGSTSTILFKGVTPPNAFLVQVNPPVICFVNDNGLASGVPGQLQGFQLLPNPQANGSTVVSFMTPPGYKPIGAVNIWCAIGTYVAARGW